MNILLIDHYAGSPHMGMEYRPHALAKRWIAWGHQVTIVAASFSHLRLKNPTGPFSTQKPKEQWVEGVPYVFLPTAPYSQNDHRRWRNVVEFVSALTRHSRWLADRFRPHVVIASSTYPLDFRPAKRIARLAGGKVVFELHDIWPQSPMELHGYHKNHPLMLLLQHEEDFALSQCDLLVSLLPYAHLYLQERGITPKAYLHVPNGVEGEPEPPTSLPQKHLDLLTRLKEKGMFLVLYVGGFSLGNALEEFVRGADKCPEGVLFVTIGNGPLKVTYKKYAKVAGVRNLLFLDGVPREQLPPLLALADCLYIGAKNLPLYRYGVSMNKLFDYMQAGKPILYGVGGEGGPVALADCGLVVESESSTAIAQGVMALQNMTKAKRDAMGERGRAYVAEHHDYNTLAKGFLTALEQL